MTRHDWLPTGIEVLAWTIVVLLVLVVLKTAGLWAI